MSSSVLIFDQVVASFGEQHEIRLEPVKGKRAVPVTLNLDKSKVIGNAMLAPHGRTGFITADLSLTKQLDCLIDTDVWPTIVVGGNWLKAGKIIAVSLCHEEICINREVDRSILPLRIGHASVQVTPLDPSAVLCSLSVFLCVAEAWLGRLALIESKKAEKDLRRANFQQQRDVLDPDDAISRPSAFDHSARFLPTIPWSRGRLIRRLLDIQELLADQDLRRVDLRRDLGREALDIRQRLAFIDKGELPKRPDTNIEVRAWSQKENPMTSYRSGKDRYEYIDHVPTDCRVCHASGDLVHWNGHRLWCDQCGSETFETTEKVLVVDESSLYPALTHSVVVTPSGVDEETAAWQRAIMHNWPFGRNRTHVRATNEGKSRYNPWFRRRIRVAS